MKIRMLETRQGAPDGITVKTFFAGQVYRCPDDLPEGLGRTFLREGWAETPEAGSPQGKNAGAATENKSAAGKKRRKS